MIKSLSNKHIMLAILLFALAIFSVTVFTSSEVHAQGFSPNYNPSDLIDNPTFTDTGTMNEQDIQAFLTNIGSGLANFSDVEACDSSIAPYYHNCGHTISAAQIIYDASQAYGINPRVILATLEKEQSLVTDPAPTSSQLNCAMGYNSCGNYVGFFTQVDNGTWLLRYRYEGAFKNTSWLSWSPSASYANVCGNSSSLYSAGLYPGNTVTFADPAQYANGQLVHAATPETVTLANAATASLYCYTPYVGPYSLTGYSGSYNFVYYYQLWFGSTYTSDQYAWSLLSQGGYTNSDYTQEFSRGEAHATLAPGGTAYMQINAINNGYQTWLPSIVHLGTSNPSDRCSTFSNNSWLSCSRIAMQQSSVIPGGTGTFNFSITAPQTPGSYIEYFNLVADGVTWMAGPTDYLIINVVSPSTPSTSQNTLTAGQSLTPGKYLLSQDGHTAFALQGDGNTVIYGNGEALWSSGTSGYRISNLVMQGDGNLVLYGTDGVPDWSSGTAGNPGAYLSIQTDGNLVIYSAASQPLWSSGTNGVPDGTDYVTASINSPATLFPGQQLSTADRKHILDFQTDGNLVLYSNGTPTWSSGTAGKPSYQLEMQADGNLVIYNNNGTPTWSSGTAGR